MTPWPFAASCPSCGTLAIGPNHSILYDTDMRCGWWWDDSEQGEWRYWPNVEGIAATFGAAIAQIMVMYDSMEVTGEA